MPLIRTQDGRFKIRNVPGVGTKEKKTKQLQAIKASQKGQAFAEERQTPKDVRKQKRRSGESPEELADYLASAYEDPKEVEAYQETLDLLPLSFPDMTEKERKVILAALLDAMVNSDAWKDDIDKIVYDAVDVGFFKPDDLEQGDFYEWFPESRATKLAKQIQEEDEEYLRDEEETQDSLRDWGLMSESFAEEPREVLERQAKMGNEYAKKKLADQDLRKGETLEAFLDAGKGSLFDYLDLYNEPLLAEIEALNNESDLRKGMEGKNGEKTISVTFWDDDGTEWEYNVPMGDAGEESQDVALDYFKDEIQDQELLAEVASLAAFHASDDYSDIYSEIEQFNEKVEALLSEKDYDSLTARMDSLLNEDLDLIQGRDYYLAYDPSEIFESILNPLSSSQSFSDSFEEIDTQMASEIPTLRIEHELSSDDDETRDGYIDAFVDEEVDPEGRIGFVNYVYDKEADALEVQAVEVMKNWRRQGVATEMYKGLMKLYPGARILNGFQTSKGKKFRKSFDKEFDVKHSETFAEVSSLASALSSRPADLSLLQELSKEDSRRGGSLRKALNDYNSAIRSSGDSGSYHRALLREDALFSALKDAGVSPRSLGKVVDAIKAGNIETFAEGSSSAEALNSDPTNKELIRRFLNEDERKGGSLRDQINGLAKMNQDLAKLEQDHYVLERRVNRGGGPNYSQDYLQSKAKVENLNKKVTRLGIFLESALKRKGVNKPNLVVNTTVYNNDEGEVFAESKPKFKRRGKTICKETCKETKLPKPDFLKPQSFSERVFAVERHANRLLARV